MSGATIPGASGSSAELLFWNGSAWVSVDPSPGDTENIAYFGSGGPNTQSGGGLADFLNGRGGADNLSGLGGNDFLVGGSSADTLTGGEGADTLVGGNATVTGSLTNSTFTVTVADDGFSVDQLIGGNGDDTFIVTSTSDQPDGGGDTDTVLLAMPGAGPHNYVLNAGASVERLGLLDPSTTVGYSISALGTGGQTISGGAGADTLFGNGGADTLNGLGGNDSLSGGTEADVIFGGTGDNTIDGGDGGDTFNLDAASNNSVTGGAGEDTLTFTSEGTFTVTGASGNFTITGASGLTTISGVEKFGIGSGVVDFIDGTNTYFVCFATGTRILTAKGEVEVERLQAGDLVATVTGRGSPMKPVLWVGRRRVVLAGHPHAEEISPIRIRAGALGDNAPHRDLLVSPDHCMFLDGALVPARLLVNGASITVERGLAEVTYFHVELEAHDVLLAEGAAAESWLDCENRSWFENASVAQIAVQGALDSVGSGWDATRACAPLVHGGSELAAIRAMIATQPEPMTAPAHRIAAA